MGTFLLLVFASMLRRLVVGIIGKRKKEEKNLLR
jgi:hypothetical protein